MDEIQKRDILNLAEEIIAELDNAEHYLKSARNWGIWDLFGGRWIVDLIKHSKLGHAQSSMQRVNYLMQEFKSKTEQISNADYRMNVSGLLTFADFMFDSGIVDLYMTAKIMKSLEQVRHVKSLMIDFRNRFTRG
ncbi:MAG: hypothetical protein KBT21_10700 [Treponema sp.]|nr:hypothetical protein [Candidatus Treponema merdequi]